MKTPEEIKKGLAACNADECHGQHEGCTYQDQFFCTMRMCGDALAYIQWLESRLAQVERERDAAVESLRGQCEECVWDQTMTGKCIGCVHNETAFMPGIDNWEWRGVCAENTEGESK